MKILNKKLKFEECRGWGSHLFLFQKLFKIYKPGSILELGSGYYSTDTLARYCKKIHSIETNKKFYNEIKDEVCTKHNNSTIQFIKYPDDAKRVFKMVPKYELVFVDSAPKESRLPYLQCAVKNRCKFIVFHDAEQKCYKYSKLKIPNEYFSYTCYKGKWTTLLTLNQNVALKLKTIKK